MTQVPLDAFVFEDSVLHPLCGALNSELGSGVRYGSSASFEQKVREILQTFVAPYGVAVDPDPHPHVFPDIVLGQYGIEVKFTANDTWRSIANSVFESTRDPSVRHIYVVFGKMGGEPGVSWARYEPPGATPREWSDDERTGRIDLPSNDWENVGPEGHLEVELNWTLGANRYRKPMPRRSER